MLEKYENHSGGAVGSDTAWDVIGRRYGFVNHVHYWMNNRTPLGNREISEEDAVEGQIKATIAARQMGRIEETHQVRDERIIRNWCQVKYSKTVYAIGTFVNVGTALNYGKIAKCIQVKGGTGYAVQMAINEGKDVFVFDQIANCWFAHIEGQRWNRLSYAPELTRRYAGIGTRQITKRGEEAIEAVYLNALDAVA